MNHYLLIILLQNDFLKIETTIHSNEHLYKKPYPLINIFIASLYLLYTSYT